MNHFFTLIKNLSFVVNTTWIFTSEYLSYLLERDYSIFIDRLTNRLSQVNILYVKIFQAIALNNNFIDDQTNNKLLKFTDNAPWNYYDDVDFEVFYDLYNHFNIVVPDSHLPINSGMIALVYKAYAKDTNKEVIIKVKRRNIGERLEEAINKLLFFVRLISFIPIVKSLQFREIIEKNIKLLTDQTNFNQEVENMNKMRRNCKNLKYVVIPKADEEVTKRFPNIIAMEYINGVKIGEVKEEDYIPFAKQVLKLGFVTSLVHGCTHGDLHGGNILFIKDENEENPKYKHKIGVLDFGIVYELDVKFKGVVFDVMIDVFNTPPEKIAEEALVSGLLEPLDLIRELPGEHKNNLIKMISEIISDALTKTKQGNQVQIYKFLNNFYSYINSHNLSSLGIRPSENFVKTQLALGMSHGVTLTLCKDDYMSLADKVITELFHMDTLLEVD